MEWGKKRLARGSCQIMLPSLLLESWSGKGKSGRPPLLLRRHHHRPPLASTTIGLGGKASSFVDPLGSEKDRKDSCVVTSVGRAPSG